MVVVEDFALDRTREKVYYFGPAEVQLMVQAALDDSMTSGRLVKLQIIVSIMISFYLASRPGSLAATAKVFRETHRVRHFILY